MTTRAALIRAVTEELDSRVGACLEEHGRIAHAIADRLELRDELALPRSWFFVRQLKWCPLHVLTRFGGVLPAVRYGGREIGRNHAWYGIAKEAGVEVVPFDWMLLPGGWRSKLASTIRFCADVGARGFCINAEPLHPKRHSNRWEGKPDEARAYASEARDGCDRYGLELWFSSWARPSARKTFPWEEFIRPVHVVIPQPYEVHGASGPDYVSEVLEQWRDLGAKRFVLGRGAHELDQSDDDSWRTVEEIREHRSSTPEGMPEAFWSPAGTPPARLVQAMVE